MDFCPDQVEHPGTVDIYINEQLVQTVRSTDSPVTFVETVVEINGEKCVAKTPVITIRKRFMDKGGTYVEEDACYYCFVQGYDANGEEVFSADAIREANAPESDSFTGLMRDTEQQK